MQTQRHFRIGVLAVSLRTPLRALLRRYTTLYRAYQTDGPHEREMRVEVQPKRPSLRRRKRYEVSVNGYVRYQPSRFQEILPYIEWAINWEIPEVMPEYLQLHASAMEVNGAGVIFPGHSGSGKSTLTAGLLTCGWRYLCDEFALIHAETLALYPYPRAICIKEASYPVMDALGIKLHGRRHFVSAAKGRVGFLQPLEVRPDAVGEQCPIRFVVFPKYVEGAEPVMTPISRAQAAFDLHHYCLNLHDCRRLGVDVLAEMIRGAECYQLTSGEIKATCDLVQRTLARAGGRQIRCA